MLVWIRITPGLHRLWFHFRAHVNRLELPHRLRLSLCTAAEATLYFQRFEVSVFFSLFPQFTAEVIVKMIFQHSFNVYPCNIKS